VENFLKAEKRRGIIEKEKKRKEKRQTRPGLPC
jgi:hypothetical protein